MMPHNKKSLNDAIVTTTSLHVSDVAEEPAKKRQRSSIEDYSPRSEVSPMSTDISPMPTDISLYDSVETPGVETEKPRNTTVLPPCRICGDSSSGYHYGAYTCEACKVFYRRSLKKTVPYRCQKDGHCKIIPSKRLSCSFCRLQKCHAIGMSKESIKRGRYTLEKKTDCIREVKKLEAERLCGVKQVLPPVKLESQSGATETGSDKQELEVKVPERQPNKFQQYRQNVLQQVSRQLQELKRAELAQQEEKREEPDLIHVKQEPQEYQQDSASMGTTQNKLGVYNDQHITQSPGPSIGVSPKSLQAPSTFGLAPSPVPRYGPASSPAIQSPGAVPSPSTSFGPSQSPGNVQSPCSIQSPGTIQSLGTGQDFGSPSSVHQSCHSPQMCSSHPDDAHNEFCHNSYYENLIRSICNNHKKFNSYTKEILDAMPAAEAKYLEEIRSMEEVFGPIRLLGQEEYNELYKSTGIDIDGRQSEFATHLPQLELRIQHMVRFAKTLPGFKDLPVEDQIALVKAGGFDYWMLISYVGMNLTHRLYTCTCGITRTDKEIGRFIDVNLVEEMFNTARHLQQLALTDEEVGLIKALCLLSPDRVDLQQREKVEQAQETIVECLLYNTAKTRPNDKLFIGRLTSALLCIRTATYIHDLKILQMLETFSSLNFPPLILELVAT